MVNHVCFQGASTRRYGVVGSPCLRSGLSGYQRQRIRRPSTVQRCTVKFQDSYEPNTAGPNIEEGYRSAGGAYYIRLLKGSDMHVVANIQAEAFHTPIAFSLLDEVAKTNFRADNRWCVCVALTCTLSDDDGHSIGFPHQLLTKAEVLDALRNKLQNNPVDSFAIFVAVPAAAGPEGAPVAVLELFLSDDQEVMGQLPENCFSPAHSLRKKGYAWLSSMAVAESERRRGCATALLDAAHLVADRWNYGFAALHVYDDNEAGIALYEKNGYQCVSIDPAWRAAFGLKRRVLMLRQLDVE